MNKVFLSCFKILIYSHFTSTCLCYTLSLSKDESENNRMDIEERSRDNYELSDRDRDYDRRSDKRWDYDRESERESEFDGRSDSDWNQIRRPDRDREDEHTRFKGWNFIDNSKEWEPHKKTISLQVLDEPFYHGGRPLWPNDEYLHGYSFNRNGSDNYTGRPSDTAYEWQNLPYRYAYQGYPYQHSYPTATTSHTTTKLDSTDAQGSTVSDKRHQPFYNSYHSPYGVGEYRGRRRFRLQIHPGLIAAPLAGLAAYHAASKFNPLLVELGLIDKGHVGHGWGSGHGHYPHHPPNYPPPYYPQPVAPPIAPPPIAPLPPIGGPYYPQYPILIPKRQEPERSSWWNPFSALTPRS